MQFILLFKDGGKIRLENASWAEALQEGIKEGYDNLKGIIREDLIEVTGMIERVREIIKQPYNPKLGGLSFYTTYMKILLENEGITLEEWDNCLTDEMRHEAFKRTGELLEVTG